MAVAEWAGTLVDWRAALDDLKAHLAPALGRAETRASGGAFIDGGPALDYRGMLSSRQG